MLNKLVAKLIKKNETLNIDGFLFSNGDIVLVDIYNTCHSDEILWRLLCKSHIDSYYTYNSKEWVASTWIEDTFNISNYTVHVGESDLGTDGFFQFYRGDEFLFTFFSGQTNPFVAVKRMDNIRFKLITNQGKFMLIDIKKILNPIG